LVAAVGPDLGELYVYPGQAHLFSDRSLASCDAPAAALVLQRSLQFLARLS
jgi:dienelactone hydrolase